MTNIEYHELVKDARYICYRYNRLESPEITPERWGFLFPDWREMEVKMKIERAVDTISQIAAKHGGEIAKTEQGFEINNIPWTKHFNGAGVVSMELADALDEGFTVVSYPAGNQVRVIFPEVE